MRLSAVEGALQRVIGTIEHRGFRVLACRVHADVAEAVYGIDMEVEGTRDVALLCRQLARLYDVREVTGKAVAAAA
jgi:acetolactate synthase regulatory subunit